MPVFIAALMDALEWLFTTRLGTWIVGLFAFLGLQFGVQHFAVQPLLDWAKNEVTASVSTASGMGAVGAAGVQYIGLLNFDKAFSMVISAIATKYGIQAGRMFLQRKATS